MRRCPRCMSCLEATQEGVVVIDSCPSCGGAFFDDKEAAEVFGPEANPEVLEDSPATRACGPSGFHCPSDGTTLIRYDVRVRRDEVEVDLCPVCRGFWLDAGEGPRLVSLLREEQEARRLAETHAGGFKTYLFQLLSGFPIEVYNPARRRPVMILTLMAVLSGVYCLEVVYGAPFIEHLLLNPVLVGRGRELWGLVTHALLHLNIWHLVGNLYFLYVFGDNLEDSLGRLRLAVLLATSVIVGGLAQAAADPTIVLGASGGISGLLGAYLVIFPRVRLWVIFMFVRFKIHVIVYVVIWLAIQVLMACAGVGGVGWYCHLGGFLTGVALGMITRRRRHWLRASSLAVASPA